MKTATIPSIRVAPELRHEAESMLYEGESLSSFVESSLRSGIEHRRLQNEFIARGLAARDSARQDNAYFSAESVLAELGGMLKKANTGAGG